MVIGACNCLTHHIIPTFDRVNVNSTQASALWSLSTRYPINFVTIYKQNNMVVLASVWVLYKRSNSYKPLRAYIMHGSKCLVYKRQVISYSLIKVIFSLPIFSLLVQHCLSLSLSLLVSLTHRLSVCPLASVWLSVCVLPQFNIMVHLLFKDKIFTLKHQQVL